MNLIIDGAVTGQLRIAAFLHLLFFITLAFPCIVAAWGLKRWGRFLTAGATVLFLLLPCWEVWRPVHLNPLFRPQLGLLLVYMVAGVGVYFVVKQRGGLDNLSTRLILAFCANITLLSFAVFFGNKYLTHAKNLATANTIRSQAMEELGLPRHPYRITSFYVQDYTASVSFAVPGGMTVQVDAWRRNRSSTQWYLACIDRAGRIHLLYQKNGDLLHTWRDYTTCQAALSLTGLQVK